MAKIPHSNESAFVTLSFTGVQAKLDVAAIASDFSRSLGAGAKARKPACILIDWSSVSAWPYEASSQTKLQAWRETAPQIKRAAFIHDRRWDRHAAILAVLLRLANAEVLSFHPNHREDAIRWLTRRE